MESLCIYGLVIALAILFANYPPRREGRCLLELGKVAGAECATLRDGPMDLSHWWIHV